MTLNQTGAVPSNEEGEVPTNSTDKLTTFNKQYGAEAATEVLPAVANSHYEIHAVSVNTNSTTDAVIKSGAIEIFTLNTPAAAAANAGVSSEMHLDTPSNTNIDITCGDGTFLSLTYHLKED